MSGKAEIHLNSAGIRKLLRSAEVQAELKRRADRIAAAAGPGMEASVVAGANRARASVITGNARARRAEATTADLTRALDAGR